MPNGSTHKAIWAVAFPTSVVAAILVDYAMDPKGVEVMLPISIPFGYFFGLLVDPDLDIPSHTDAKRRWSYSWITVPIRWWWTGYARLMRALGASHRSFITHMPGISTAIRLLWFVAPMLVLMLVLQVPWGLVGLQKYSLVGVWIGLSIADTFHALADLIEYMLKRARRYLLPGPN